MRNAIERRKHPNRPSFKRIVFFVFLFIFIGLFITTIFYSIPTIFTYLSHSGYISPLASKFSIHEALGNGISTDMVKKEVEKAGFSIKTISDYDDSIQVELKTGEKILFSKKKPLNQQISSLQLISSRLTIEGKHFTQLDLRFDRPFLVPK